MAEHTAPTVGGGPNPSSPLQFLEMAKPLAKKMVKKEHYAHQQCQITYAWGIQVNGKWLGVLTMGKMYATEANEGVCGKKRACDVLELNRVWLHDSLPQFTESKFIGWCLRQVRKKNPNAILVSYADTSTESTNLAGKKEPKVSHIGVVYQATNWIYTGLTGTGKQKDKTIKGFRDYRSVPRRLRGPQERPCERCGAPLWRWDALLPDEVKDQKEPKVQDKCTCECGWVWERGGKNWPRPWPGHIFVLRSRKHRYIWFANPEDKNLLKWEVQPYPKKGVTP
jgi:hypothetical protein